MFGGLMLILLGLFMIVFVFGGFNSFLTQAAGTPNKPV